MSNVTTNSTVPGYTTAPATLGTYPNGTIAEGHLACSVNDYNVSQSCCAKFNGSAYVVDFNGRPAPNCYFEGTLKEYSACVNGSLSGADYALACSGPQGQTNQTPTQSGAVAGPGAGIQRSTAALLVSAFAMSVLAVFAAL